MPFFGLGKTNIEKMKQKRDVKGLIKALNHKDAGVRQEAAKILGEIGDARAVEPLIEALKDANSYVRSSAAKALDKLGWSPDMSEGGAAYWIVNKVFSKCVKIGAPAVDPLISSLKEERNARRAVDTLVEIGAVAVEPLIAALKDPNESVRSRAASALRDFKDERVVEPLIAALKDIDFYMKQEIANALGKMGDEAVEPLITALKDRDMQLWAAIALGKIGDEAVEPLITALKDTSEKARWRAAMSLGEIGDSRAVEPLITALKDTDRAVRQTAASVLGEIGDERAVESLIQTSARASILGDDETGEIAEKALAKIGQRFLSAPEGIAPTFKKELKRCSLHLNLIIASLLTANRHLHEKISNRLQLKGITITERNLVYELKPDDILELVQVTNDVAKEYIDSLKLLVGDFRMQAVANAEVSKYVCDGCGRKMAKREGYLLRSWQKNRIIDATNKGTWPPPDMRAMIDAFGPSWKQAYIAKIISETNDWLLCENCVSLLDMNHLELNEAKSAARNWWLSH